MIDPIAFHIGPLTVRWYGIAYAASLTLCLWILTILNKKRPVFKDNNQIFDFVFWIFLLGVLVGGRLGYVLFYNLPYYIGHPVKVFALWEGGMSFHGGLIGTAIVGLYLGRKHKFDLLKMTDLMATAGSLATMLPRVANFINRELYGRVIENAQWKWMGVNFGDGLLRYPSQLFQSAEAAIVFLIMLTLFNRKPKKGVLTASYLILYGLGRFIIEFWRQPDAQIGFILRYFTLGQFLSLSMVLVGIIGIIWLRKGKRA
jgi:phosphatidylglycerol---prolipoprotein diacylglyceryl transferase